MQYIFLHVFGVTMPPYIPTSLPTSTLSTLDPVRLVMLQQCCMYCGKEDHSDIYEWRIFHLFGILHCSAHAEHAEQDCKRFMREHKFVRLCDAYAHNITGPFLRALGTTIPVRRTSGAIETTWRVPILDEIPVVKYSSTTRQWGLNLSNGSVEKFVALQTFRDPEIAPHLSEEARRLLGPVDALLRLGFYET